LEKNGLACRVHIAGIFRVFCVQDMNFERKFLVKLKIKREREKEGEGESERERERESERESECVCV